MKKENLIMIGVIGGLIFLALGFYAGLSYAQKQIKETGTESALADLLTSKIIGQLTTTASGDITEISGRSLTLSSEEETLTVLIVEDASIYRLSLPEEATTPQPATREEIDFSEIKVGDRANVSCVLKADSTLEGVEVTLAP